MLNYHSLLSTTRCVSKTFIFLAILFLSLSLTGRLNSQATDSEYIIPIQLNDGWEVAGLNEVGLVVKRIMEITNEIRSDDRFDLIHSMLIVKNGKLAHEARLLSHVTICDRSVEKC